MTDLLTMNFNIPLWFIIIVVMLFLVMFVYFIVNIKSNLSTDSYLNYRNDVFFDMKWSWDYYVYNGNYTIKDLTPYCNVCDFGLSNERNYTLGHKFVCDDCGYSSDFYNLDKLKENIERQIERKITQGSYNAR